MMNSFQDLVVHIHIRDLQVITSTKQRLDMLLRVICSLHPTSVFFYMPPRVFLASYMVSFNPIHIFKEMTPEATALKDAPDKMTA
jgi:hypothetical protein